MSIGKAYLGVAVVGAVAGTAGLVAFADFWTSSPATGNSAVDGNTWMRVCIWAQSRRYGVDPLQSLAIAAGESAPGFDNPYLGDRADPGGPSIGGMQVRRLTAIGMHFVDPSTDFQTYWNLADPSVISHWDTIGWGVQVLKVALANTGGDFQKAAGQYNGGGTTSAYAINALNRLTTLLGGV